MEHGRRKGQGVVEQSSERNERREKEGEGARHKINGLLRIPVYRHSVPEILPHAANIVSKMSGVTRKSLHHEKVCCTNVYYLSYSTLMMWVARETEYVGAVGYPEQPHVALPPIHPPSLPSPSCRN